MEYFPAFLIGFIFNPDLLFKSSRFVHLLPTSLSIFNNFLAEEENRLKTAAPDPSAKVSDPPASPSDELAVRAVDGKRSPEPDVFVSGGDRRGPSTENATDLAGPPVELAGPIPKNEDSLPRQ